MWFWIALGVAVAWGLVSPFSGRLKATGLWAGRALAPPETASMLPAGLEDALTHGWPSVFNFVWGLLPFAAAVVGVLHAWWAGIVVFVVAILVSVVADRSPVPYASMDRYLLILLTHARRRHADFLVKRDHARALAIESLIADIEGLLVLYSGSGVRAPSVREARAAPFGQREYWLKP